MDRFEEEKSILNHHLTLANQRLRTIEEKYIISQSSLSSRESELSKLQLSHFEIEGRVIELEDSYEVQEVVALKKRMSELEQENKKHSAQLQRENLLKESLNSAADNYIEILSENQKLSKKMHKANSLIE